MSTVQLMSLGSIWSVCLVNVRLWDGRISFSLSHSLSLCLSPLIRPRLFNDSGPELVIRSSIAWYGHSGKTSLAMTAAIKVLPATRHLSRTQSMKGACPVVPNDGMLDDGLSSKGGGTFHKPLATGISLMNYRPWSLCM